jgi:putative transposase
MTIHVHLLMTPNDGKSLSKTIQMLGRCCVQYFNCCYQRTGTLREGRCKATLIDSETYLLTCMRYIELNPVRAKMVTNPSEYPWSSYRCNAVGQSDELVTPHSEYRRLGTTDEERQLGYRHLFNRHIPESSLSEIRESTHKAWVLGNDRFKQRVQEKLDRRVEPKARGGDRKSEKFRINRV